jgi:hypothetical protein
MWVGTIDDARVYNRVLTSTQIMALYNQGSNVVKSFETNPGEMWTAGVTPFSESEAGATEFTDSVTIEAPVAATVTGYESRWAGDHVEISWTLVEQRWDALGFEVWRSGASEVFARLDRDVAIEENRFVLRDYDLDPGRTYRYRVVVVEDGEPAATFEISATTPAAAFALMQNQPNPFNPLTRIGFSVERSGPVTLRVYDIGGRLVRTLVDRTLPAGAHAEVWDGRDDAGSRVASGIYFYRLDAGSRSMTKKAVLLR